MLQVYIAEPFPERLLFNKELQCIPYVLWDTTISFKYIVDQMTGYPRDVHIGRDTQLSTFSRIYSMSRTTLSKQKWPLPVLLNSSNHIYNVQNKS